MRFALLLSCLMIVEAGVINNESCNDGILILDKCHVEEVLKEGLDRPYHLSVDYGKNIIYFSYSADPKDDKFITAKFDINSKKYDEIEGLQNGFAQSVDLETHDVYIGGSNGLYKYDHRNAKVELIGEQGNDIWTVYFKNNILFFSVFPTEFLYTFINGETARFKDLEDTKVDRLVIDNENDIVFFNATGLYSQKLGTKSATYYADSYNMRAVTTNIDGVAYCCRHDGIYSIDKTTFTVNKIVSINDTFGVAFDNDNNIIYSDAKKLARLKRK